MTAVADQAAGISGSFGVVRREQKRRRRSEDIRLLFVVSDHHQLDRDGGEQEREERAVIGRDGYCDSEEGSTWLLGAPAVISFNGVAKRFDQRR